MSNDAFDGSTTPRSTKMNTLVNESTRGLNLTTLTLTVTCLRLCGRLDGRLMALLGAVSASATTVGLTG